MNIHSLFSENSELYAKSRPSYPKEIFGFLAQVSPQRELAWDCACGNGQVSIDLIEHFERVEATDVSREQIAQAHSLDGVNFSVSEAEKTSFSDESFDLICVAQALHWFDYERFWPEVDRVLKPQGIFAAWGYIWPLVSTEINCLIAAELMEKIEPYWNERNKLLWNHYRDVNIPYSRLSSPTFDFTLNWDLNEFFAHIHSWSAVQRCMESEGGDFFDQMYKKVRDVWGQPRMKRKVKMDFCFTATRKE